MGIDVKEIVPDTLLGPRSYFTDIDPNDRNYDKDDSIRKLKLQLLTKEKIVVAASSLFHDIWLEIFKENLDLVEAIEGGIIIPAIRNQFKGVEGFFEHKKYGEENRSFYLAHVTHSVPWDLMENANWFKEHFINALRDEGSVLRKQGGIEKNEADNIISQLNEIVNSEPNEARFLQRKHIEKVAHNCSHKTRSFLDNYANLIYRLSGSRVVNSEGHFPQSNLTKLEIVGNDKLLSDEGIFWDIYVETVFSYLGTAIRLTPDRLNNLSFKDILKIRKSFFDIGFTNKYDVLLASAKEKANIHDPEKLVLHMQEISDLAVKLRNAFSDRVHSELSIKDTSGRENALWQVANILSLIASPSIGLIVGVLSSLKSIPEITAPISTNLSTSIKARMAWMREFANRRIGWSETQRKSFLDAYKKLLTYGLN